MTGFVREYYGDETRWFFGVVVNNRPPAGMEGMVQIRIHGIHSPDTSDIPQADLPWAKVMSPTTSGGTSGVGAMPQLQTSALVFGIFMDGMASQLPLVMGSVPHTEHPNSVQASGRVQPGEDFNRFAANVDDQETDFVEPENITTGSTDVVINLKQSRTISMKFFIDNGYTVEQAAGMTGVLEVISAFNPELSSETTGFGILQWKSTGARYKNLLRFAATLGPKSTWYDLNTQLLFILQELRTTKREGSSKLVKSTWMTDPKNPGTWYGDGSVAVFIRYVVPVHIRDTISVNQSEISAQTAYDITMAL